MVLTTTETRAQQGAFGSAPHRRIPLLVAPGAEGAVAIVEAQRGLSVITAIVVKRCFTWTREGALTPAPVVWTIDRASAHLPDHDDALAAGSDFVPWKSQADVTIVGHASFAGPRTGARIVVEIAGRRAEREVRASAQAPRLPLSLPYLMGTQLSPHRATPPGGGRYPGDTPEDTFQTAAHDLRIDLGVVERRPVLALTGLLPGFEESPFVITLPSQRPLLRVIDRAGHERGVDAALDTIHLDLDARTLELVYRETTQGRPADTLVLDGWRELDRKPDAAVGAPRSRAVIGATTTEDDAVLDREPALDPHVLWAARADALAARSPEPSIDLPSYARVHVALAEQPTQRTEVLREHGFDELTWTIEDRAWLERMGEDSMRGDPTVAAAFGDLFVEEQDRLSTPREEAMTVAELARISVMLEESLDLAEVLAAEELTLAQWMRLDRRFAERADDDPRVARELDEALARERARVSSG